MSGQCWQQSPFAWLGVSLFAADGSASHHAGLEHQHVDCVQ